MSDTFIHPTALAESEDVGVGTSIWAYSHIMAGARIGRNCNVGDHCFVGVNATFRDGISVAPRCVIGAGALVMRDTEEGDVLSVPGTKPYSKKSWEIDL